jgi:hypothetical protein
MQDKAASNMQQATSRQAKKGERMKGRMGERKRATSCKQQATSRQAKNKQQADNADLKRFSQIRKKSAVIFQNLRHLRAYCLLPYNKQEIKLNL